MSQATLHALIKNGDNYMRVGDQYYKQALEQDEKYRQYLNQLSNIKTKLNLFFNEIDNQIGRVSKLLENVRNQYVLVINQVETEHKEQFSLLRGLTQSLDNLGNTELHPLLQEKTEKKNLHDFVNVSQVKDILTKGKARIQEYQNLTEFGNSAMNDMDVPQKEVTEKCSSLRVALNELIKQCPTNRDLNRPILNSISHALTQVRNFKEDLGRLGRQIPVPDLQSLPVEEDKKIQTTTLNGIKETYLMVEKNTLVARATVHKMKEFWRGGKWCAKELETLSQTLTKQKKDDLERLKRAFIKLRMNELLFEEIRELTSWYTIFPVAYEMCLVEIVRRREVHIHTKKRVDEMREEMNKLFQDEEDQRHQFVNEFGKFLPMNMIPELIEQTPRYTIPQQFKLNLPNIQLTEEEILDIKRRCCNSKKKNMDDGLSSTLTKNNESENGKQT